MITIDLHRTYDVSGDRIWARIHDFYDLSWLPAVSETRRIDASASRVAVLPNGAGEVIEQLVESGQQSHRYRVTSSGPMPVRDFEAIIRVEDVDATTSRVVWQARFEATGGSPEDAEAAVTGVFTGGLDRLAELTRQPVTGS